VDLDRDATAVVLHGDAGVDVDGQVDPGAESRQGLVDGVVDHLEDEVVKATLGGVADVHPGALPDCFEALENLDVLGPVVRLRRGLGGAGRHARGNVNLYPGALRDAT
jgi:hypothetical protein